MPWRVSPSSIYLLEFSQRFQVVRHHGASSLPPNVPITTQFVYDVTLYVLFPIKLPHCETKQMSVFMESVSPMPFMRGRNLTIAPKEPDVGQWYEICTKTFRKYTVRQGHDNLKA